MNKLADLSSGAKQWYVWVNLALSDINSRYRRTILGPFWTVLNAGILVAVLGVVYAYLWRVDISDFLPYFSAGYISWVFFTTTVNEGAVAFTGNGATLKEVNLPYSVYIYRVILRNNIVFSHTLFIHLAVLLFFGQWPNFITFFGLLLGLIILNANLLWISLLLATICSKYRDVNQMLVSILQIFFFITPIFWKPELLEQRLGFKLLLADFNPVFHLIELIRSPLLGSMPSWTTLAGMSVSAVIGQFIALHVFYRYRARIPYWT